MNEAQYGDLGAVSSWCFQTITISYGACRCPASLGAVFADPALCLAGGKTAQAKVMDAYVYTLPAYTRVIADPSSFL